MDSITEGNKIDLQEKGNGEEPPSMFSSLLKSIAYAQNALNKHTEKLAKHRRLRILYKILLCVAIGFIWVSLIGPLSITILPQPYLANLTRLHVTTVEIGFFCPPICTRKQAKNPVLDNKLRNEVAT